MANTIPDIQVLTTAYSDVNTLSGLIAGTPLVITNKAPNGIRLQIAVSQPASDSEDGEVMYPGPDTTSIKLITAGENTVWALSLGHTSSPLRVQDNT